jgi:hypothetical protein
MSTLNAVILLLLASFATIGVLSYYVNHYHKLSENNNCKASPCSAVPSCSAVPCTAVPCTATPGQSTPCTAVPCTVLGSYSNPFGSWEGNGLTMNITSTTATQASPTGIILGSYIVSYSGLELNLLELAGAEPSYLGTLNSGYTMLTLLDNNNNSTFWYRTG